MEQIQIKSSKRAEFLDITARVQTVVKKNGITRGVIVFLPHTTAGVTISRMRILTS